MKEKELRLALVLFGGVSLAIYQHGINREILNLVRASRAYHAAGRRAQARRADAAARQAASVPADASTTAVYLDLLQALGRTVDLRVVVDVIAGASAGGINGVALARALAHDLSLAPLTDMWLAEADMLRLLAPEARARAWSKWYFLPLMRPLMSWLSREEMLPATTDSEMRERVFVFLRSRWFKPPLDGRRLSMLLLDGLMTMDSPATSIATRTDSLIPSGTRLDLLVTVTDFRGIERTIFIHDPLVLHERDHRHLLHFSFEHSRSGVRRSDFDFDNLPALAFAGRASASYPGAFPPAQIQEIDDLLASRGLGWPTRTRFLETNFAHYRDQGMNPEGLVLVDGSVLDNKPVLAAIDAIRQHSAFREVDRRLIFVDPHPGKPAAGINGEASVPSWFATLRGALSDLPRQQPVHNELAEISRYNKQIRRLKETILDARPQIAALVEQSTGGRLDQPFTTAELRHWRLTSTNLLARTPVVYNAWFRALVMEAIDFLVGVLCAICGHPQESPEGRWVERVVERWARRNEVLIDAYHIPDTVREYEDMPLFARMVIDFGIEYKKRRINFVLHEVNGLYQQLDAEDLRSTTPEMLDALKADIHECLDRLEIYDTVDFVGEEIAAAVQALFREPQAGPGGSADAGIAAFVEANEAAIGAVVDRLRRECKIAGANADMDAVLSSPAVFRLGARCRRNILTGYLGYFQWDVILRPALSALARQAGPIEEILIDRISPDDATTLVKAEAGKSVLLGGAFAGFGGFLSRTARENDYLWGRLHAIDRLIDIVASTGGTGAGEGGLALRAFKKRAFEMVLEEEGGRLQSIGALIARLRELVARL